MRRREDRSCTVAEMYMEGLDGVALLRCLKEEKIQTNILIIGSVLLMEITKEILTRRCCERTGQTDCEGQLFGRNQKLHPTE